MFSPLVYRLARSFWSIILAISKLIKIVWFTYFYRILFKFIKINYRLYIHQRLSHSWVRITYLLCRLLPNHTIEWPNHSVPAIALLFVHTAGPPRVWYYRDIIRPHRLWHQAADELLSPANIDYSPGQIIVFVDKTYFFIETLFWTDAVELRGRQLFVHVWQLSVNHVFRVYQVVHMHRVGKFPTKYLLWGNDNLPQCFSYIAWLVLLERHYFLFYNF